MRLKSLPKRSIRTLAHLLLLTLSLPTALSGAVNVTVNAGSVATTINANLFGQNMSVYDSTALSSNTGYTQAVSLMGAPLMRFPGGGYGDMVDWNNIEAGPFGSCTTSGAWYINTQEAIAFANAGNVKLQCIINYPGKWCPTFGPNHAAATIKAADWVRYMNVTGGGAHKVTYWEIGNECYFSGDPGYEANGATYGTNFVHFYNAMKAVDSTIKVGAIVQYDATSWSQSALSSIRSAGVTPDFAICHAYPRWCADVTTCDQTAVDTEILTTQVDVMASIHSSMNSIITGAGYASGSIPYWMTEYRSSVPENKANQWVDALWSSQFLLEMARLGWQGANIWAIKNGYSTAVQSDYGLLCSGTSDPEGRPDNSPRPTYYVFPFLSKVFGKNMVSCSDDGANVRSWASKDASGNLTVFMVNNDPNAAVTATVAVSGFSPGTAGNIWTMISSGTTKTGATTPILQRRRITINGTEFPSVTSIPGTGNSITTGASFPVTLPAASMVMVRVPTGGSPVPTATFTRTPSPTPTTCSQLLNGCNSLTENGTWSGTNASRVLSTAHITEGTNCLQANVTLGAAYNAEMFNLSGFSPTVFTGAVQLKVDLYVDASIIGSTTYHSLVLIGDSSANNIWFQNLSSDTPTLIAGQQTLTFTLNYPGTLTSTMPISRIIFAYNASAATTGNIYVDNISLMQDCGIPTPTRTPTPGCSNLFNGVESLTENGNWTGNSITARSLSTLHITQGTRSLQIAATNVGAWVADFALLDSFVPTVWSPYAALAFDVYVDAGLTGATFTQLIPFADCSTCSTAKWDQRIAQPGVLVAGQNSVTVALEFSGGTILATDPLSRLYFTLNKDSATGTGNIYIDNIRLLMTCGVTPSPTPTRTSTFTISPTFTRTPTVFVATNTFTPSFTMTRTNTSTNTATATLTRTNTIFVPTATFTATSTLTRTNTPTNTLTATLTRTNTIFVPTATFTATSTLTRTNTPTNTLTATLTRTNTIFVPTATFTATSTLTRTNTFTPTNTITNTFTRTATVTNTNPVNTFTFTRTNTFTPTNTITNTFTRTFTATVTNTNPVNTFTSTPTFTRTNTFTATNTVTSTFTRTFTATVTNTNPVNTFTPTPTFTRTNTFTATNTITSTFTRTFTATATVTNPVNTFTFTLTPTLTRTPTFTPTNTITSTATRTFTVTNTFTPSITPTGSLPPTNTFTNTLSPTVTRTNTLTFTPTFTRTFTATNTVTSTFTRTFTATVTNTNPVNTVTPTPTFTRTNTFTATNTVTSTFTRTFTATVTNTNPVNTFTFTLTPTLTRTPTFTPTNTITSTATRTFTVTNTFTPSITPTGSLPPTNTFTNTLSPTVTRTNTLTFTPTFTATVTFTRTSTFTSTNTVTNTFTRTFTATATNPVNTFTFTLTPTFTRTSTFTSTNTITNTATRTFTPTNTYSPTITYTGTASPTGTLPPTDTFTVTLSPTRTFTPTNTLSPTPSSTHTLTHTWTATPSNTVTYTYTPTTTYTFTATRTWTPTFTLSFTPTNTWTASQTSSPTVTATGTPSFTGTASPSSTYTNTFSPTNTLSPTLTFTPTLTPTDMPTETDTFTFTPTRTYTPTATHTVTRTWSSTLSPTASFTATLTSTRTATASWTATSSSTATSSPTIPASPTPTSSYSVTPTFTSTATYTWTPTETWTITLSPSPTWSPTRSSTQTHTPTYTPTLVFTATATYTGTPVFTSTWTETPVDTPLPGTTMTSTPNPALLTPTVDVVPYPNPCSGACDEVAVNVTVKKGGDVVRIQLFTTAYRKISEMTLSSLPVGMTPVQVVLRDKTGKLLSNGVYYIRVVSGDTVSIGKLVILK